MWIVKWLKLAPMWWHWWCHVIFNKNQTVQSLPPACINLIWVSFQLSTGTRSLSHLPPVHHLWLKFAALTGSGWVNTSLFILSIISNVCDMSLSCLLFELALYHCLMPFIIKRPLFSGAKQRLNRVIYIILNDFHPFSAWWCQHPSLKWLGMKQQIYPDCKSHNWRNILTDCCQIRQKSTCCGFVALADVILAILLVFSEWSAFNCD